MMTHPPFLYKKFITGSKSTMKNGAALGNTVHISGELYNCTY